MGESSSFSDHKSEDGAAARLARLRDHILDVGLDAALVSRPVHVRYLTGAAGDHSLLLVTRSSAFAVLPAGVDLAPGLEQLVQRVDYASYSLSALPDPDSTLFATARRVIGPGHRRVGIEADHLPVALRELLGGAHTSDISPALRRWRRCKGPDEIAAICRSLQSVESAIGAGASRLAPGITELEVLASAFEDLTGSAGPGVRFDMIVAFGERTAHAAPIPLRRRAAAGDLVLMDLYPVVDGYCADLTRMFVIGPPTEAWQRRYRLVVTALEEAEKLLRPGVTADTIDERVRMVLRDGGEEYEASLDHHSGHGIGLSPWEEPWIGKGSRSALEDGDVVALEPALYVRGLGGIRVESNYHVSGHGARRLDVLSRELITAASAS